MRRKILLLAFALGPLGVGCADAPTAPVRMTTAATHDVSARPGDEPGCSFERGTTTCTTTTTTTETTTRQVYSGCVAGPPPFRPGRRVSTFEDTYLVTVTTTSERHGRAGVVYDTQTSETRELLSSREISRVCEAL